jgi:hypothetical protein
MPLPAKNTRLRHHLKTVVDGNQNRLAIIHKLEAQERAIDDDPELTTDQKRRRKTQAQLDGQQKIRKLDAEIAHAAREAEEAAHEERRDRPLDPQAQARVRDLRARKVSVGSIRSRAKQNRDAETLAALRAELLYFDLDGDFADTRKIVAEIDRDLAEIGEGVEAANNRAIVELGDALAASDAVGEFALKKTLGQAAPVDRLRMAYATSAGRERDDDA